MTSNRAQAAIASDCAYARRRTTPVPGGTRWGRERPSFRRCRRSAAADLQRRGRPRAASEQNAARSCPDRTRVSAASLAAASTTARRLFLRVRRAASSAPWDQFTSSTRPDLAAAQDPRPKPCSSATPKSSKAGACRRRRGQRLLTSGADGAESSPPGGLVGRRRAGADRARESPGKHHGGDHTPLPEAFHLLTSRTSSASLMVYSLRSSACQPASRLSAPAGAAPSAAISPARLSRLCTGRNSSTWGSIARLP